MSKHIKSFTAETKALSDTRSLLVTISTPSPDRMGDVVAPKGAQLTNYLKNPVVLFAHDYGQLPVAKCAELNVTDAGIQAKVQFPHEGIYDKADTVYELYKDGYLNAWSIGFSASQKDAEVLKDGGYQFNKWELLEFSAVPVPANAEALTIMRSKGLEPEEVVGEEVNDEVEDEALAEDEHVATDEGAEVPVSEVVYTDESVELHFTDGTTKRFAAQLKQAETPKEPETNGIPMTVDTLKLLDGIIGRALRDYKAQQIEGSH